MACYKRKRTWKLGKRNKIISNEITTTAATKKNRENEIHVEIALPVVMCSNEHMCYFCSVFAFSSAPFIFGLCFCCHCFFLFAMILLGNEKVSSAKQNVWNALKVRNRWNVAIDRDGDCHRTETLTKTHSMKCNKHSTKLHQQMDMNWNVWIYKRTELSISIKASMRYYDFWFMANRSFHLCWWCCARVSLSKSLVVHFSHASNRCTHRLDVMYLSEAIKS